MKRLFLIFCLWFVFTSCDGQNFFWSYHAKTVPKYGYLYNYYAINDSRGITASGWKVLTGAEWSSFMYYLASNNYDYLGRPGWTYIAKSLSRSTGWLASSVAGAPGNTDYAGKRDSSHFSAYPSGWRLDNGSYMQKDSTIFLAREDSTGTGAMGGVTWIFNHPGWAVWGVSMKYGVSVRVARLYNVGTDGVIADNAAGPSYTQNDGRVLATVKLGDYIITKYNLAETKYRNGDNIPTVLDAGTWSGLTTGAKAPYNNNEVYVFQ